MSSEYNETVLELYTYSSIAPGSSGWIRLNCPFCEYREGKVDTKYCLGINAFTGFWHCFRCSAAGKLSKDKLEHSGISLWDKPDDQHGDVQAITKPPAEYTSLYSGSGINSIVFQDAKDYLLSRNVGPELWEKFQIGACIRGKYAYRIIIPLLDADDKWRGFIARDWTEKQEFRYKNSLNLPRNEYFFNHSELFRGTDDPLFLVEGIFDVLRLWPNAVASLGKPSDDHFRLLLDNCTRDVFVCFDGDARREGWAFTQRLLLSGIAATYVELPACKDPGSLTREMIYRFVKE